MVLCTPVRDIKNHLKVKYPLRVFDSYVQLVTQQ